MTTEQTPAESGFFAVRTMVDGGLEDETVVYRETDLLAYVGRQELAAQLDPMMLKTEIFAKWHGHSPAAECNCARMGSDDQPRAVFNDDDDNDGDDNEGDVPTKSGYAFCDCRGCMAVIIAADLAKPEPCALCQEAGCELGDAECSRDDAYETEVQFDA